MTSSLHGAVAEFDPATDIGQSAADASVAVIKEVDRKKVAVVRSVIGKRTYSTFRDFCSSSNPKEKTFPSHLLQQRLEPKR